MQQRIHRCIPYAWASSFPMRSLHHSTISKRVICSTTCWQEPLKMPGCRNFLLFIFLNHGNKHTYCTYKKIQTVTYLLQHVHKRFLGHRHILGTQRRLSWHVAILLGRFLSSNFWESISISILWWWSWDNRAQLFWTAYHDIRFSPTFINSKNEICAPWFFWCSPVCLNHSGMDLFFQLEP